MSLSYERKHLNNICVSVVPPFVTYPDYKMPWHMTIYSQIYCQTLIFNFKNEPPKN
jgi:hypothetical protein